MLLCCRGRLLLGRACARAAPPAESPLASRRGAAGPLTGPRPGRGSRARAWPRHGDNHTARRTGLGPLRCGRRLGHRFKTDPDSAGPEPRPTPSLTSIAGSDRGADIPAGEPAPRPLAAAPVAQACRHFRLDQPRLLEPAVTRSGVRRELQAGRAPNLKALAVGRAPGPG